MATVYLVQPSGDIDAGASTFGTARGAVDFAVREYGPFGDPETANDEGEIAPVDPDAIRRALRKGEQLPTFARVDNIHARVTLSKSTVR